MFNVGDVVKCIDGRDTNPGDQYIHSLIKNQIYVVASMPSGGSSLIHVRHINSDIISPIGYFMNRFELVGPTSEINHLKAKAEQISDEILSYVKETYMNDDLIDIQSLIDQDDYLAGLSRALTILGFHLNFEIDVVVKSTLFEV